MIGKRFLVVALATALATPGANALAATELRMLTGSPRGTAIEIGRDLAALVAPQAAIALDVLPSAGSGENLRRLRDEPGTQLAIVQLDAYGAFVDRATQGDTQAQDLVQPLRVIMPLYSEEIHFIVRADAGFGAIDGIRNARINVGEPGSGAAFTTATIYRLMFNASIPEANTSFLSDEAALVKLVTDKTIDVVAVVAGQPAKLLREMKPEARRFVKLLAFDDRHPSSNVLLRSYLPATVRAANYPNLLADDVPALAVKSVLVSHDHESKPARDGLVRLARSLCRNFAMLQGNGHPKWREVTLMLPDLGPGWTYYPPTAKELYGCIAERAASGSTPPARVCSREDRTAGLCK